MSLMKKIKVDHNQQYLVYEDNTPFFYLADTAWCAPQLFCMNIKHIGQ